jgi:hydrogenase-4 component F
VDDVHGLLVRRPRLAVPFLIGVLALLGFPPFGLFFTETALVVAGVQRGLGWEMGVTVVLLLVVSAGIGRHLVSMTLGPADGDQPPVAQVALAPVAVAPPLAPIALALTVTSLLGVATWPLAGVLGRAAAVLGAGLGTGLGVGL